MKKFFNILVLALILGGLHEAWGAVVYDQTATHDTTTGADCTLVGSTDNRTADDFTPSSAAIVDQVSFYGSFDSGWQGSTLTGFRITVYNDSSGVPGSAVSSQDISLSNLPANGLYNVPLNTDVSLSANTRYWLTIQGVANYSGATFKVNWASPESTDHDFQSNPPSYSLYNVIGLPALQFNGGTPGGNCGRYWHNSAYWFNWNYGTYSGSSFPSSWTSGYNSNPEAVDLAFQLSGSAGSTPPPPSPTWNATGSGDWNGNNWVNGVPNGDGAKAIFGSAITSPAVVYTLTGETLGTLTFDSSNSYTLVGALGQGLTLSDTAAGAATVNVNQGAHELNLPLTLAGNTTLSVSGGATLYISDPVTLNGFTLSKQGSGTVVMNVNLPVQLGSLAVSGGALVVGSQAALAPATIDVSATGVLAGTGEIDNANILYESSAASTYAGSIRGTSKLTVDAGSGILVLTGSNTFSGGIVVDSGTLIATSAQAIPDGSSLTVGSSSLFPASPVPLAAAASVAAVPEPGTWLLLCAAVAAGWVLRGRLFGKSAAP